MLTSGRFRGPALAEVVADATTGVKVMVTFKPLSGKLSERSVAVKVTISDVSSVTVKLADPVEPVLRVEGETTALTDEGTRVTDLPLRGRPLSSLRITSMVALEWPSAGTEVLPATISESPMTGTVGGGVPKVTWTSSPTSGRSSVVSVAR